MLVISLVVFDYSFLNSDKGMKTGYGGFCSRFTSYGSNNERFLAFAAIKNETKVGNNTAGFILFIC